MYRLRTEHAAAKLVKSPSEGKLALALDQARHAEREAERGLRIHIEQHHCKASYRYNLAVACKEHQRLLDDYQSATKSLQWHVRQLSDLIGTDVGDFNLCLDRCRDARQVCDDLRRDLDAHFATHGCQQKLGAV